MTTKKKPAVNAEQIDAKLFDRQVRALVEKAERQIQDDIASGGFLVLKWGCPWGPITFGWAPAGLRQTAFRDETELARVLEDVFGHRSEGVHVEAASELMDSILEYVNKLIWAGVKA